MTKFLALLKYLDRSRISQQAVKEIGSVMGYAIDDELAADIATAFKTRGEAGLLRLVPRLAALVGKAKDSPAPEPQVFVCSHCGHSKLVQ